MNQKGFANMIWVVAIIMLVGGAGYFAFVKTSEPAAQQPTSIPVTSQLKNPTSTPIPVADETTGWKTYTNTQYNFQLALSDAWKGYRVFHSVGGQGIGSPDYFNFLMPISDKSQCQYFGSAEADKLCGYDWVFEITITAKDGNPANFAGTTITQDSSSLYLYRVNNALSNDLKNINFNISGAISTFKFTK